MEKFGIGRNITALVSYESQLEDSASSDESRIKTNFEGNLAAVTAEKSCVIEQLENDLKKVQQELKSLSSLVDMKNQKIIEYETEIMKLKTSYGTIEVMNPESIVRILEDLAVSNAV